MKHYLLIAYLFFFGLVKAQDIKRTSIWYFGQNAGIDFNTDPPTPLTDGAMNTDEGCAAISDTNGNLLFYTNGEKIWNRNHQIMDNGDSLLGSWDATQPAIIVPQPGNDSLFYVFTTDSKGQPNGLRYSVINIKANSGLGKVTDSKNILLQTPVCEKLTATHHENGIDVWVMAHGFMTDSFFAYIVTKEGLINCPIINDIGSRHGEIDIFGDPTLYDAQGAIKFSSDGNLLAVSVFSHNIIELFKFNKTKGILELTNRIPLGNPTYSYSCEFSNSGKYLYVGNHVGDKLLQFDLNLKNTDSIAFYKKTLYTSNALRGLQMAKDNKIYNAVIMASFTSRINRPDSLGDSCLFAYNGFNLSGKRSEYGLPNFITSYFYTPKVDFSYQTQCSLQNLALNLKSNIPINTLNWYLLKNNVKVDSAFISNPMFNLNDTGLYKIMLVANSTDTVIKEVYIPAPLLAYHDTLVCNQSHFTVTIPSNYRCISWQDGSDTNNYTITKSGSYIVSAYNANGCYITDTVNIMVKNINSPNIRRSNDTLYTDSSGAFYQWYYNNTLMEDSGQRARVFLNGTYKLVITDSFGCSNTASFNVTGLAIRELANYPFVIYPNPSSGKININYSQPTPYTVTIHTILGQPVFSKENIISENTEIEIGEAGVYIIEITDYLGNTYVTKQIIH